MILLAFDTSAPLGSVAVGRIDFGAGAQDAGAQGARGQHVVLAARILDRQGAHGSELIPAVDQVLGWAGIDRRGLDGVVVGAGPGSFTGLRVAAATAKGLSRALEIPLFAVSSLAAGAATAEMDMRDFRERVDDLGPFVDPDRADSERSMIGFRDSHRPRYVLFDARGDRVYGACFLMRDGTVEVVAAPHGGTLADVLELGPHSDALFMGSGARLHEDRIRGAGFPVLQEPAGDPMAQGLLRVVAPDPEEHRVDDVSHWEPSYLREWKPGWARNGG